MLEQARSRRGVALMGICNVTPDSFSDGGLYYSPENARARVDELCAEGADIVDVGGESTRPGAPAISPSEQLARVLEVVRYASTRTCVSIDTTSPAVAAACLDAGASVVNDVSCLRDEELAKVAAAHGAALILSHARGTQTDMRGFGACPESAYADVLREVIVEWTQAAERAVQLGMTRSALLMDPGLGFAKSALHSAELLRRTSEIVEAVGAPVLIGASRKSFLTLIAAAGDAEANPEGRIGASIAAALFATRAGAAVLRVHDVRQTRQAVDLMLALGPPLPRRDSDRPVKSDRPAKSDRVPPASQSGKDTV